MIFCKRFRISYRLFYKYLESQYKTDSQGRVVEVKGLLQLNPNDRNTYQQGIAGGECRKTSDCGGHIIAAMFKGGGEAINLVPMDRTLNGSGGEWYALLQAVGKS